MDSPSRNSRYGNHLGVHPAMGVGQDEMSRSLSLRVADMMAKGFDDAGVLFPVERKDQISTYAMPAAWIQGSLH